MNDRVRTAMQLAWISVLVAVACALLWNVNIVAKEIRDDARAWHDAGAKP